MSIYYEIIKKIHPDKHKYNKSFYNTLTKIVNKNRNNEPFLNNLYNRLIIGI